jgi:hypothetical protein
LLYRDGKWGAVGSRESIKPDFPFLGTPQNEDVPEEANPFNIHSFDGISVGPDQERTLDENHEVSRRAKLFRMATAIIFSLEPQMIESLMNRGFFFEATWQCGKHGQLTTVMLL